MPGFLQVITMIVAEKNPTKLCGIFHFNLLSAFRSHLAEREEAEQSAETYKRRMHEVIRTIGDSLNIDTESGKAEDAAEKISEKASNLLK